MILEFLVTPGYPLTLTGTAYTALNEAGVPLPTDPLLGKVRNPILSLLALVQPGANTSVELKLVLAEDLTKFADIPGAWVRASSGANAAFQTIATPRVPLQMPNRAVNILRVVGRVSGGTTLIRGLSIAILKP